VSESRCSAPTQVELLVLRSVRQGGRREHPRPPDL